MTRTPLRPAPGARTGRPVYSRSTLLTCAIDVFLEHGYEGTSMGQLADRLGITKSSIYHHVPGKAELFRMVLDRAAATLRTLTDDAAGSGHPAAGQLVHITRAILGLTPAELGPIELLLSTRDNQPEVKDALSGRHMFETRVTDLIRRALADRDTRDEITAEVRARLLLDILRSLITQCRAGALPQEVGTGAGLADLVVCCAR